VETKGFIQVYTGDGKGKTTAAIGLTCRAAGAGLKTMFLQFLKTGTSSEIAVLRDRFPEVTVRHFGSGRFVRDEPSNEDVSAAQQGLEALEHAVACGEYDLVVADEVNIAVELGLVNLDRLLRMLRDRPGSVEIVLTGRDAHPAIVEAADLVTEMKKVKHYLDEGVEARTGVEE
jgi:cob(I)alamin adenosyltransferase